MNHLMIDIETLDTRPTSIVFQVEIVVFDEVKNHYQEIFHLDILPQILAGRTIDSSTVKFWNEQQISAWTRSGPDIIQTEEVYRVINDLMGEYEIGYVWSNSPSIMRSLRESLDIVWEFPSVDT